MQAQRQAVRDTWLADFYQFHPLYAVQHIFAIGKSSETTIGELEEEQDQHDDILLFDLDESYYALPLKVVHSLDWIRRKCIEIRFLLKSDDDTFFFSNRLLNLLAQIQLKNSPTIYGRCFKDKQPVREEKNKW